MRAAESPEGALDSSSVRRCGNRALSCALSFKASRARSPLCGLRNAIPLYKQVLRLARDSRQHIMYVSTCVAAGRAQKLAGSDGGRGRAAHARHYAIAKRTTTQPGDVTTCCSGAQACAPRAMCTADGNFELLAARTKTQYVCCRATQPMTPDPRGLHPR